MKIFYCNLIFLLMFQLSFSQVDNDNYFVGVDTYYSNQNVTKTTYKANYTFPFQPIKKSILDSSVVEYSISPSFGRKINDNMNVGLQFEYSKYNMNVFISNVSTNYSDINDAFSSFFDTTTISHIKNSSKYCIALFYYYEKRFENRISIGINSKCNFYLIEENYLNEKKYLRNDAYFYSGFRNRDAFFEFSVHPELHYNFDSNIVLKLSYPLFAYYDSFMKLPFAYEHNMVKCNLFPEKLCFGVSYYF